MILKLQKKHLRVVTFSDPMAHSNPVFIQYNILKVVNKWKYSLLPIQYSSYFGKASNVHHHQTRLAADENFYINQGSTTQYGLRTVHFSCAKLWNSFSNELSGIILFPHLKQILEII